MAINWAIILIISADPIAGANGPGAYDGGHAVGGGAGWWYVGLGLVVPIGLVVPGGGDHSKPGGGTPTELVSMGMGMGDGRLGSEARTVCAAESLAMPAPLAAAGPRPKSSSGK